MNINSYNEELTFSCCKDLFEFNSTLNANLLIKRNKRKKIVEFKDKILNTLSIHT